MGRPPGETAAPPKVLKKNQADANSSKQHQAAPSGSNQAPPAAEGSTLKPREEWDKVTQKDVPDYIELETIYCKLSGKSTRDMYVELGGGGRADQIIPAWDSFLGLKNNCWPKGK
jgi:hypothetical protein